MPGAPVVDRSPVVFPSGVAARGSVVVETALNTLGEVTDARVVSGPEEFRRTALSNVLNWRFAGAERPRTVQSTIQFVSAPPQAPEIGCLSGIWAQDQPSQWRWRFEVKGGGLSISRTDGFVSGTFARTGTVWTGQLLWGSGEKYNNVVLSPGEGCNTVRTNQSWWFKR